MKLIFLDIDGVLNGFANFIKKGSPLINHECVRRLNTLVESTGADIVLSSSWRYMILGEDMTLRGFRYLLSSHGLTSGELIGHTPRTDNFSTRSEEISSWIKTNNFAGKYVVLDDFEEMPNHPFIHTDGVIGLTDEDVKRAIEILTPGACLR